MNGLALQTMPGDITVAPAANLLQLYPVNGADVSEALEKANANLAYVAEATFIFNRSHSNLAWSAHVLSHDSDTRNIRQISAELKRKRDALIEAKHEYISRKLKCAKLREEATFCDANRPAEKAALIAESDKWESFSVTMQEGIMGATKDVAHLTDAYRHFKQKIMDRHEGRFDEEIFEIEEREYWVKRLFRQSMRDIRERGSITKGEQEALEQSGFDPYIVEAYMKDYLNRRNNDIDGWKDSGKSTAEFISGVDLDEFIDQCGEKFKLIHDEHMVRKGLPAGVLTEHLYIEGSKNDS